MTQFAQRVFTKRVLYLICFMALNLIEFLRATQAGNIWKAAANCTGPVMMVLIFSALPLRELADRFNRIYVLLCAAAMVAVHFYWTAHQGEILWGEAQTAVLNVCWIGIAVRYFFRRVIVEKGSADRIPFRPGIAGWLWIALSVLMIASASERWWPLWFLLMFGCFYLTEFSGKDWEMLWEGMIDGTILSFFAIQIYAYGFRPYDELRYKGAFSNSNMMALYYLIVYLMCLFRLHTLEMRKGDRGWKLLFLTGAGGMLSFQLFTMGRTAWVASFVVTVLYGTVVMRGIWRMCWPRILCRGAGLLLAAAMTFLPVYGTIRWFPTILHHPVWYEGEYSVARVHSFDSPFSEKYVELDEFMEALLGRILHTLNLVQRGDPLVLRAHAAVDMENLEQVDLVETTWTEDVALRTRLTIYKTYWDNLNWFGHGLDQGYYLIGEEAYMSRHAQNLWLQMAYTYGIPAGVLSVVLSVAVLWVQGRGMMRRREDPYAVIPFFVCVAYLVFGVMEIVWNPGQLIMFLVFFVQHGTARKSGCIV